MQYYTLEKSNIKISKLGLGSRQADNWFGSDKKSFTDIFNLAVENGLNFIDTAEGYADGKSESILGEIIKDRQNLVIASKIKPQNCKNPTRIKQSLEASLKRLKTDYIDIYFIHWPPRNPIINDVLFELEKFKAEGKIRAIGVSNFTEPEFEEISDLSIIDCLQPCYNLLWRQIEENIVTICEKNKIDIIPYSPLAQGVLSGKYKNVKDIPEEDSHSRKSNLLLKEDKIKETLKILDFVNDLAEKYKVNSAQIAINWILSKSFISSLLTGQSKKEQLVKNIEALNLKLEDSDLKELDEISFDFSQNLKPHDSLWGHHPRTN